MSTIADGEINPCKSGEAFKRRTRMGPVVVVVVVTFEIVLSSLFK